MSIGARKTLLMVATFSCAFVFATGTAALPAQAQRERKIANAAPDPAKGAELFQTHCGRCHNPPTDLSPREAPAVIRQMRVRAMLSAEDEQLILQTFAPAAPSSAAAGQSSASKLKSSRPPRN